RSPALGTVSADDHVILQRLSPAVDAGTGPILLGEQLQRRTDQDYQEKYAGRRHHQDIHQSGRAGDRSDVTVAGGGERDDGVVRAVQQVQLIAGDVAVATSIEVDQEN